MRKILALLGILMLMLWFIPPVESAVCTGQDCDADISLTIGNSDPTIPWVQSISNVDLTGGTTKTVWISFNVSDTNGYEDINFTSGTNVTFHKIGESNRTNATRCLTIINTTTESQFNCSVDMQFYDTAASWNVTVATSDDQNAVAYNVTVTFTVNALDYVSQDITSIAWAATTAGTDDEEADAPMVLTNGGNQNYSNVSIKAYNCTGTTYSQVIFANNFSVDMDTGQTSGQTYMNDSVYVQNTELDGLDQHGSSVTENVYFYVDLKESLLADTYTQDTTWSVQVST